jgi:hypothetical protein
MTKITQVGDFALNAQFDVTDKADTMREAARDLATEYMVEGRNEDAIKVINAFNELPDESAARLLDILTKVSPQK